MSQVDCSWCGRMISFSNWPTQDPPQVCSQACKEFLPHLPTNGELIAKEFKAALKKMRRMWYGLPVTPEAEDFDL